MPSDGADRHIPRRVVGFLYHVWDIGILVLQTQALLYLLLM